MNLKQRLKLALCEDTGPGDITSRLLVPANAVGKAVIRAKEAGIFCGGKAAREIFRLAHPKIKVHSVEDGRAFSKNAVLLKLQGPVRAILAAERTALNLLGHLCGIATQTREFVKRAGKVRILDTRKTTPLWRDVEKYAVKCGGGKNHRMGLYDAVFVKENHRPYSLLRKLPKRGQTRKGLFGSDPFKKLKGKFEIEVRNLRELKEAFELKPNMILFDNFKPAALKRAVQFVRRGTNSKIILEASGGVTLQNIRAFARTGVDQISIGSLTHSVKAIDLSLLMK